MPRGVYAEVAMVHSVEKKPGILRPYSFTTLTSKLEEYLAARKTWQKLEPRSFIKGVQLSGPAFAVTFDDGYRDFIEEALPILEKYEVPCLLSVATSFIEQDKDPFHIELVSILESLDKVWVPLLGVMPLKNKEQKVRAYHKISRLYRRTGLPIREKLLVKLRRQHGGEITELPRQCLNWDELEKAVKHPLVTVGSHTQTHPTLTALPGVMAYAELKLSKEELEKRLARRVDLLVYPYGSNSPRIRRLAEKAGYLAAFTTVPRRLGNLERFDRFAIPRFDINTL